MKRSPWRFGLALLALPLLAAALAMLACLLLIPPAYTARLSVSVQAPLGRLPMYGALLQSHRMADRVIDHFSLQSMWREPTRSDARQRLARAVRVGSTKGGLLVIEVDAPMPWLAADMAAFYLQSLQALADTLRAEAAAERRRLLAPALRETEAAAVQARAALARSGLNEASLRGDAGTARGQWRLLAGRLRQAEAQLAVTAQHAVPGSPAYDTAAARVAASRGQLGQWQAPSATAPTPYEATWREQQRLERLLQRLRLQDEEFALDAGRVDEALLLVDRAIVPERAGRPYALAIIAAAWALAFAGLLAWRWRQKLW